MVGLARGTVSLAPHDPAWAERYAAEVDRLRAVVGDDISEFHHVGSTAVPGVPAKPIVDVLAVVPSRETARALVPTLEANGYEHRPNDGVPDRVFLAKGPRSNRTHYLSLTERGSDTCAEQIAFRDYLRANPPVAAAYAGLKRDLAARFPDDRAAYTERKGEFVERVLDRAGDGPPYSSTETHSPVSADR
ncbi:GrpB family protein [Halostella salina]|uniref:GrpB family protein n=1 Tax=Halostella salina TaxID=1547897 RepID=UPI000EF8191C|nr:GrpB family protein [Halostella salina]